MKILVAVCITVLAFVLGLFWFRGQSAAQAVPEGTSITLVNSAQLKVAIVNNSSLQLVDVRKQMEVASGVIAPAKNIDFYAKDFVEQFADFDKEAPLYLYCRSGRRSNKAAHLLAKEGFKEIYDLNGGYLAWEK